MKLTIITQSNIPAISNLCAVQTILWSNLWKECKWKNPSLVFIRRDLKAPAFLFWNDNLTTMQAPLIVFFNNDVAIVLVLARLIHPNFISSNEFLRNNCQHISGEIRPIFSIVSHCLFTWLKNKDNICLWFLLNWERSHNSCPK